MTTNVAIIGLGIMGTRMLQHMRKHEEFNPNYLWDPNPIACEKAIKQDKLFLPAYENLIYIYKEQGEEKKALSMANSLKKARLRLMKSFFNRFFSGTTQ